MRLTRTLKKLAAPLIDVLLPPACWATSEPCSDDQYGLSEISRLRIAKLAQQPFCLHCGLTIGPFEQHDARDPCARCGDREVGVVRIARVGTFTDPLIQLVHRLKFGHQGQGSWEIAPVIAPYLYQAMLKTAEIACIPVDIMIPVPLHWQRRARRGFNQAEELARSVNHLANWPVEAALKRIRATHAQARIESPAARAANVRGAFSPLPKARRGALAGKHVWLIDDVSTTGATLHAANAALRHLPREARPASINAAVVCVVDHRGPAAE